MIKEGDAGEGCVAVLVRTRGHGIIQSCGCGKVVIASRGQVVERDESGGETAIECLETMGIMHGSPGWGHRGHQP